MKKRTTKTEPPTRLRQTTLDEFTRTELHVSSGGVAVEVSTAPRQKNLFGAEAPAQSQMEAVLQTRATATGGG